MLYGKELAQSIQKRCKIQPGMLVKSSAGTEVNKIALVVRLSPACEFDRDYVDQRITSFISASLVMERQPSRTM